MAELSEDDVRRWQTGQKSLSDLAAKAGVSKQAVAQKLKRRGIVRHAAQGASPAGAVSSAPAPAGDPVAELMAGLEAAQDRDEWLERAAAFIDGTTLNLIAQAHTAALGGSPALGATQIKSLVAALSGAVDVLERTGRLAGPDESDRVSLRVTVMSLAEEAEIRQAAEVEAHGLLDPDDTRSAPAESPQTGASDLPPPIDPAADAQPAHTPAADDPSNHPLADQLRQLAGREGVQRLRQLALSVGAPAPRDLDRLIDALVEHADDDPDAAAAIQAAIPRSS